MIDYVDTSFWIAILSTRDQWHRAAILLLQSLSPLDRLVTSEFVLIELLNYFSERGPQYRRPVAEHVRQLEADLKIQIVPLSHELYSMGIKRFERSYDKGWSITDCTSFILMEDMGIHHALAFDDHFRQAGFQVM